MTNPDGTIKLTRTKASLLQEAAPDLLAACRYFVAARTNNELHLAVAMAQAAIAKAEGKPREGAAS